MGQEGGLIIGGPGIIGMCPPQDVQNFKNFIHILQFRIWQNVGQFFFSKILPLKYIQLCFKLCMVGHDLLIIQIL